MVKWRSLLSLTLPHKGNSRASNFGLHCPEAFLNNAAHISS
jgi:hypothetical protein